jgi:hypothetical protein
LLRRGFAALKAEFISDRDASGVYFVPTFGTFGPFIQQDLLLFSSCITIIAKLGGAVKDFIACYNEIIFAVEYDGDGLAFYEDAARTCRVGVDDCRSGRRGHLDGNHFVVDNVNDAKQRCGED